MRRTKMKIDVTVWCWSIACSEAEIARLSAILTPDELGRADRLRISGKRGRFIAAHAGMRLVLGAEIGVSPRDISFASGPRGKPSLVGSSDVRFNLSHSHDLAVLGVCRGVEIGADIERVRHIDVVEQMAARFFATSESEAVARASGEARDRLFMRLWTCKEAYLKATGEGLSRPFDEIVVALAGNGDVERLRGPSGEAVVGTVHTFDPAPGYVGALVTGAEQASISVVSL